MVLFYHILLVLVNKCYILYDSQILHKFIRSTVYTQIFLSRDSCHNILIDPQRFKCEVFFSNSTNLTHDPLVQYLQLKLPTNSSNFYRHFFCFNTPGSKRLDTLSVSTGIKHLNVCSPVYTISY